MKLIVPTLFVCWSTQQTMAYQLSIPSSSFARSSTLSMKRGRGSLGREVANDDTGKGKSNNSSSKSSGFASSSSSSFASSSSAIPSRWCTVPKGQKLPTEENKVTLLDTNLPTLIDKSINPTGAVSVLKYNNDMYCFSVNCPCCKIPLTKAMAKDKDTLECNFCKSNYSLTTGQRMENKNTGLLGGMMQSVLSSSPENKGALILYQLGEDTNGKLMIDPTPGSGASASATTTNTK